MIALSAELVALAGAAWSGRSRNRLLRLAAEAARMEQALDEMVKNARLDAELMELAARFGRGAKLRVINGGMV